MFGDQIRALRQEKGITQTQVADNIGVSNSAVGMYEQNRRMPDAETMGKIADFFGVNIDFLLGRTVEREPYEDNAEALALLRDRGGIYYNFAAKAREMDLSAEDMDYILKSFEEGGI